ncbi:TRAP-type C4-dicarboxylate transport system permease small subunit [Natronocella acetinitrilica]|uniref:TRAP transporter small permease protein n=1 Tax=Natronocella acetinitrilica TaxID=414046 RepID=A0AAE3KE96_9GAMM|nr:TRAP transporter small permease [Natronocella acetinitrilica]MCP1677238.1 TRAP-type C4-dicarboxylate transport system permease small subunit [Natronocella acetinitrilica]
MAKVRNSDGFSSTLSSLPHGGHSTGLRRAVEVLVRLGEAQATLLILIIAILIGYEVIARYVFNQPTGFANQAAAYAMPFIAFMGAAGALRRNAHVTVDALIDCLNERLRLGLAVVTEAFSVILLLIITWFAVLVVMDSWESGTRAFSTVLTFPEYVPQVIMPVGLGLLTLQQVTRLCDAVREYRIGVR